MDAESELIQLLVDTRDWAANPRNVDTSKIYSDWASPEALLSRLDQHIADARNGEADFAKLWVLYAPTAGLSEILSFDGAAAGYLALAARFDALVRVCSSKALTAFGRVADSNFIPADRSESR